MYIYPRIYTIKNSVHIYGKVMFLKYKILRKVMSTFSDIVMNIIKNIT